ncbi:MAG: pseudouridine synthase [Porphyromonadaceae bacterium]|nr:pseudouridine synthase [Porphyromonadaceae bacterium]
MSTNNKNQKQVRLPRALRPHFTFEVDRDEEIKLLDFLTEYALKDRSRTTVKQLLHDRFISVNEEPTTQFDRMLCRGDKVVLHPTPLPAKLTHPLVDILWQDDELIMIHKGAGIPTVSSGMERDRTAMQIISEHLKKFNPRAKVFLLNRVDKDSAGFVLMAKSAELQAEITEHWEDYILSQTFAVAIEGEPREAEGNLAPPSDDKDLRHKSKRMTDKRQSEGRDQAGLAHYRLVSNTPVGSLLIVELKSGRNNRLRKQFAALKTPILGDWRNGSRRKDLGRVALETIAFSFVHPATGKRYDFDQPIPTEFRKWLRQVDK